MIRLFDTVKQGGGSLKVETELRLIRVDVVALFACGAFPIEFVPGIIMGLLGWPWWLAGLAALLIETIYIYGSYHTTRWFIVRKNIAAQDRIIKRFSRGIEKVRNSNANNSLLLKIIRWLVKVIGSIYQRYIRPYFAFFIDRINAYLHKGTRLSKLLLYFVNKVYALIIILAGFAPQTLRPMVVTLAIRNRANDCFFLFIGTAIKLYICSYFGPQVYEQMFKYTGIIYSFFKSIVQFFF